MTRQSISLLLAVFAMLFLIVSANLGFTAANPYITTGEVPPDAETYPPVIAITSPVNNTAYNTSRLALTFNVTAPQSATASSTAVIIVSYEADWKDEPVYVHNGGRDQVSLNLWLSKISEGQHSIVVKAVGHGLYKQTDWWEYKEFRITSTAAITFTVDETAPVVCVLPPENVSSASEVSLDFTVNEACSEVVYSLNGRHNVTVSGNSTIPPLPAGQHNVTFYAWDAARNVGVSETVNFTVTEIPEMQEEKGSSLLLPGATVLSGVVVTGIIVLLLKRRAGVSRSIKV